VRVTGSELAVDGEPPVLGGSVTVRATVDLAGLDPDDVDVQAVIGRVTDTDDLHAVRTVSMTHGSTGDYTAEVMLAEAGALGYTVRVLPKHDLLATPAELGRVVLA
jgi:starch phosphorylase